MMTRLLAVDAALARFAISRFGPAQAKLSRAFVACLAAFDRFTDPRLGPVMPHMVSNFAMAVFLALVTGTQIRAGWAALASGAPLPDGPAFWRGLASLAIGVCGTWFFSKFLLPNVQMVSERLAGARSATARPSAWAASSAEELAMAADVALVFGMVANLGYPSAAAILDAIAVSSGLAVIVLSARALRSVRPAVQGRPAA